MESTNHDLPENGEYNSRVSVGESSGANAYPQQPTPPNVRPFPASGSGQLGREEIERRRQLERDGIPFDLEHDDYPATVRLLNLSEKATVLGLPTDLQETFIRVMRDSRNPARTWRNIQEWAQEQEKNEYVVNAVCCLGFVKPRLVMSEGEVDQDDPNCWPVQLVHTSDRVRYFQLVTNQDREGLERARKFLRGGVARLEDSGAVGSLPRS